MCFMNDRRERHPSYQRQIKLRGLLPQPRAPSGPPPTSPEPTAWRDWTTVFVRDLPEHGHDVIIRNLRKIGLYSNILFAKGTTLTAPYPDVPTAIAAHIEAL